MPSELLTWCDARFVGIAVQSPIFLAVQGEAVHAPERLASLREVRWQVRRIVEAPDPRAEVLLTCAEFLLEGVWDDLARESLIRLVVHANCPREVAERLASHTSQSLRDACAKRLEG
jgi:hypothetical protein